MRTFRQLHGASMIALGLMGLPAAAWAESLPQSQSPGQAAADGGEIVVTAQHRQQSVQDVPIAITAVTGEALARQGVTQAVDLARVTPGLSTVNATSGGTPIFAIRGIGLDDFNPNNNSGVATYVDGVAINSPEMLSGQMFDVDRVEVLKGPQGTLYGRNATGGAINFISREPTDQTTGYVHLGYGRWNTVDLDGALSGKLSDTVSARIAGTWTKAYSGWQVDKDTGQEMAKPDRGALRGTVKFKPSSDFTALLNVHYSRDTSLSPSPQASGNEALLGDAASGKLDTGSDDPRVVRTGGLLPRRNDVGLGAGLTLTWNLPTVALTAISGWDHYVYRSTDNNDGMPGPTFDFYQHDRMRQFYQEVRAASRQGLLGGRIDWVAGASYSHDTVRGLDSSDQSAGMIGAWADTPDYTTSGLSIAQADYLQTRDSFGLFANTETHLTSTLGLIAGLRYSHDRVGFVGQSTEQGSDAGGVLFHGVGSVVASLAEAHVTQNLSYRVGLNFKPSRALMVYATVSSAYKSGAYYASPALDAAAWGYVPPEKITDYEVGAKARAWGGRLTLSGSVYYYDYRNRQSQLLFVSPDSGALVVSLGTIPKSRVFGQEFEVSLRPLPGLELGAGANHLDTRIQVTTDNVRGAPLYSEIVVGSSLAQAPDWSFNLRGRYETAVAGGIKGSLSVGYSQQGRQASVLGDPNAIYGINRNLDARVELAQDAAHGWSVALWGRNLTDCWAPTYSYTSFYGGKTLFRQQPRSYGVQFGYSF